MPASLMYRARAVLRRFEDRAFRLASEAEYRLRITPRNVRLEPSAFDRRILRLFVIAMPILVGSLFIGDRSFRIRLLFAELVVLCVVLALLLLLDAWPGTVRSGRGRSPTTPPFPPRFAPAPPVLSARVAQSAARATAQKAPPTRVNGAGGTGSKSAKSGASSGASGGANNGAKNSPGNGSTRR
ncbi:MAG: hypothetical protein V4617_17185 [Gemmatimonadota bacterium]